MNYASYVGRRSVAPRNVEASYVGQRSSVLILRMSHFSTKILDFTNGSTDGSLLHGR